MAARIGMANQAATVCLVAALVLQVSCIATLPHADAGNYLWGRLDIPLEVQPLWPGDLGYHTHGIAALSPDWPPCMAFLSCELWAAGLAIFAALRRNWLLFFAMQVLLAVPGEAFGTHEHEVGPAGIVVSAGIVVIGGLTKRRFRLPVAAGLVAIAALGLHGLTDGHVRPPDQGSNQVFDEAGNGWQTDTDATGRIQAAMAKATGAQRPAADYVLAQMAYLRQDWLAAKALAPRLRPDRFSHGPYTTKRLFVLKTVAAGRVALAPSWLSHALAVAFYAALTLILACAVTGWRLSRRAARIDQLGQRLAPLRATRRANA